MANFAFLTRQSNLDIGSRPPEDYLPEIEDRFPGALASQWVPMEPDLWRLDRYLDFLEARKVLLSRAANEMLQSLLHDRPLPEVPRGEVPEELVEAVPAPEPEPVALPSGIETDEEEDQLLKVNDWLIAQGLPEGEFLLEIRDPDTEDPTAILDLAWPAGLQEGLTPAVTFLLDEGRNTLAAAKRRRLPLLPERRDVHAVRTRGDSPGARTAKGGESHQPSTETSLNRPLSTS